MLNTVLSFLHHRPPTTIYQAARSARCSSSVLTMAPDPTAKHAAKAIPTYPTAGNPPPSSDPSPFAETGRGELFSTGRPALFPACPSLLAPSRYHPGDWPSRGLVPSVPSDDAMSRSTNSAPPTVPSGLGRGGPGGRGGPSNRAPSDVTSLSNGVGAFVDDVAGAPLGDNVGQVHVQMLISLQYIRPGPHVPSDGMRQCPLVGQGGPVHAVSAGVSRDDFVESFVPTSSEASVLTIVGVGGDDELVVIEVSVEPS